MNLDIWGFGFFLSFSLTTPNFNNIRLIRVFSYNFYMAWDYTKIEEAKQAAADPKWFLERLINYGLNGQKIDRAALERYLFELNIPHDRRAFLEAILWDKNF